MYNQLRYADVVKLADTPDLGSGASGVQVQVLSSAPIANDPCSLQSSTHALWTKGQGSFYCSMFYIPHFVSTSHASAVSPLARIHSLSGDY